MAAVYPFTNFNFSIEINRGGDAKPLVAAAFSECDGLEMSMEVKTIREGGDNGRQIRLNGPASFGQLVLKRGMTDNFDLWDWFGDSLTDPRLRANAEVVIFAADGSTVRARFVLSRCVPVKLKAPQLNARDGQVAVEELQLAYESLTLKRPDSR
ncbi:phage tail protein [Pseudomonas sp. CGJS7]|uniref:phage tail protein n=1 Tax=Pseudomonas sp. CGJS7 TaxID=3109348 RepID=UPI00300B79B2